MLCPEDDYFVVVRVLPLLGMLIGTREGSRQIQDGAAGGGGGGTDGGILSRSEI
jgi:hypothetical protein